MQKQYLGCSMTAAAGRSITNFGGNFCVPLFGTSNKTPPSVPGPNGQVDLRTFFDLRSNQTEPHPTAARAEAESADVTPRTGP